jgi:hypothetical protein
VFLILIAVAASSFAFAAPATADEGEYVAALHARFPYLSAEHLLSAGRIVCDATSSGSNSADTLLMVQKKLGVSVPTAGTIVSAAVVHLDC